MPRDALIVVTGLSGSGKSSLAFDTIYAEGQRRYVESLSSYARQFLGLMEKPDVDSIDGLSPAISIDQKTTSRNPRSTVGTVTEIHDYLRLLWARIGIPHCPNCGEPITGQSLEQITDRLMTLEEGRRFMVMAPVVRGRKGEYGKLLEQMRLEGYSRVKVDGELRRLDEEIKLDKKYKHDISVVVDRLVMKADLRRRLSESVEAAAALSGGLVQAELVSEDGSVGRGAGVLRAVRVPELRYLDTRARAEDLLLQLAPRGLRALPWPRLPAGDRPRAGRSRPDPLAGGGRSAALAARPLALLEAGGRGGGREQRSGHDHALAGADGRRARDLPLWHRLGAAQGQLPQPLRPQPLLQRPLRGDRQQSRAPLRRDRLRAGPRADRGLHGRAALPRVRRCPAAPREPRGQGRRNQHCRVQRALGAGGWRVDRGAGDERDRARDRPPDRAGDHRAALLPGERRHRLPLAGPLGSHALRRRGAADPAGDPDRLQPGRGDVHPRRALDRPAPARQREADRDPRPAPRPRQHGDRGRARRGDDARRRPPDRPRAGRRRARRLRDRRGDPCGG